MAGKSYCKNSATFDSLSTKEGGGMEPNRTSTKVPCTATTIAAAAAILDSRLLTESETKAIAGESEKEIKLKGT